jgi:hypothetical protein
VCYTAFKLSGDTRCFKLLGENFLHSVQTLDQLTYTAPQKLSLALVSPLGVCTDSPKVAGKHPKLSIAEWTGWQSPMGNLRCCITVDPKLSGDVVFKLSGDVGLEHFGEFQQPSSSSQI